MDCWRAGFTGWCFLEKKLLTTPGTEKFSIELQCEAFTIKSDIKWVSTPKNVNVKIRLNTKTNKLCWFNNTTIYLLLQATGLLPFQINWHLSDLIDIVMLSQVILPPVLKQDTHSPILLLVVAKYYWETPYLILSPCCRSARTRENDCSCASLPAALTAATGRDTRAG